MSRALNRPNQKPLIVVWFISIPIDILLGNKEAKVRALLE